MAGFKNMIKTLEKINKRNAYSLEWYHRNKYKKGIKDRIHKTPEEQAEKRRERERRIYREKAEAEGRIVKKYRPIGTVTREDKLRDDIERSKRYRVNNLEFRRKSAREWAKRNRKATMKRFVVRYHTDPQFNLAIKIRRRIYMAIRNQFTVKAKTTISLLGISYPEFKKYIEGKFTEGMTWNKLFSGEIHLDHIIPVSSFDLSKLSEQKKAMHYTNLQPLWAKENLQKGCKVT